MFKKEEVPPYLWEKALWINGHIALLKACIETEQGKCQHDWKKDLWYDESYCGRVDGVGRGQNVVCGFRCKKCHAYKKIGGMPWEICRKCGGKMKHDRTENDGDKIFIHKCVDCGHEHDTT